MRIAHFGPSALPMLHNLGGAVERRVRELAAKQAQAGHSVIVYSADSTTRMTEGGVTYWGVGCRFQGYARTLEYLVRALAKVRRWNPTVLHFHNLPEGAALAVGIPAVKLLSYDFFKFRRGKRNPLWPLYKYGLSAFSHLLPVSEYCLTESRAYWHLGSGKMKILYNGVNLQQFCPDQAAGDDLRRDLGLNDAPVILYVGRVCEQKGTDTLVEAYRQLTGTIPRLRLVVAGPPERFGRAGNTRLTLRIQQAGGLYLGPVEDGRLRAVYNLASIFVMPTREFEMFGMAVLEAQACGIPVVCSLHGGLPEVVSRESARFFQPGNAGDLSRVLRDVLLDTQLRETMSRAALCAAARFSWEGIANALDIVYKS